MPLGAIPQNQIDALPLVTAAQAAAPTVVTVVGQKVTKRWDPAASGINGQNYGADPDDAAGSALFSNWLDVGGCNQFVGLLTCTIPDNASRESAVSQGLLLQYRTPNGLVLPRSGNVGVTMFAFPAVRTPDMSPFTPPVQVYEFTFPWSNAGANVTLGFDVRLWFRRTIGARGIQSYALTVWGQGS